MCVQLASFGVDSWQLLAVWPNLSSGVNWSVMSRRFESGSMETRQADKMAGTSVCQAHISRRSFDARFRAFRLKRTLQPVDKVTINSFGDFRQEKNWLFSFKKQG
jgi:hypothetical protein